MYSQQPDPASSNSAPISFKVSYLFLALALLLLAILIAPPPIFAAGISVNTFADTLVAGDGNCSLREAVLNANSDSDTTSGDCVAGSGADTINLQAGTYTLSIPANWNDPESGDLDISSELTIIGMGVENSTIDASGLNHRLFEINGIATISDVTVTGGSGVIKGGGFLVNDDAQLHVTNTHIHHNSATSLGGGIANLGGYVTFSETLLSDNSAAVAGGAAYNADSGQMDVLNSAVLNNQAGPHRRAYYKFGGGFKNYNNANLKIQNSTISGNQAADDGGGIYNHSAKVTLINVTMVANRALSDGGAIDNFGTAEFVNSIIVGNTASAYGKDCRSWYGWPLNNLGNNLLNSSSSCPSSATDQTIDLADLFVTGLAPLGDYGGATPTYELLPTSPALDNGNGAYCPSDDQRGYSRPLGAGCDIGSYENANQSGPIYTVNTADDVDDGACDYDHCSLREAILAANAKAGKDTIVFDLDAMGSDLIAPTMSLPDITDPVTIDGSGFIEEEESAGTAVTIDGSNVDDEATDGFVLRAGDSDIFGLIITNFDGNGIAIYQLGNNNITNNQIKNNGENGVVVHESIGNTIRSNEIFENGALGIDLNADGVTNNDNGDGDAGANDSQNAPFIIRAVPSASATNVEGSFNSTPNSTFTLDFYLNQTCDPAGFGEGQQLLGSSEIVTNANGNAQLGTELSQVLPSGSFLTATATNGDGSTSEFSECTIVSLGNDAWTRAYRLPLTQTGTVFTGFASQHIDQEGQSRWYKLRVEPNSNLVVTLTNLPGNYDLTVYKDIAIAFNELTTLNNEEDLTQLTAEFAPDAFSPDAFSPDAFSPDAFSPDAFSPDAFSPDAFSPDAFSPDAFSPDAFSPDAFSPDAFSPDAFSPDAFSPDAFSPDAFSSAQTRSLLAVSAFNGNASEGVRLNTWDNTGDFYIRVRGRNGEFNVSQTYDLNVELLAGQCSSVNSVLPAMSLTLPSNNGNFETIILTDMSRMEGSNTEKPVLQNRLAQLAARPDVAGVVVDVGSDAAVSFANQQANDNPTCPYAKNLVAQATRNIVDLYWQDNPLRFVVIVGNDDVIPFFRHPDQALLANERNYVPPVRDNTASQASLKLGYVLSQDAYGSRTELNRGIGKIPIPSLAVGRLVETAVDATGVVDAYLSTSAGVVPTPTSSLVTGYDFLEDAANAVSVELQAGIGVAPNELITPRDISPEAVRPYPDDTGVPNYEDLSWTAGHLVDALSNSPDIAFLAGHFSASSALAADYDSRLLASDLVSNSNVDLFNAIIFSAGCHAGYNIVNAHNVPGFTPEPDWAQAFAQKQALLVAGTGYQYGDTDFIEYSERLYLEFSTQLRAGTGPVSVGEAMVRAKQNYLANTAELRPIHEKALLQATIFGLPMLSVDMPTGRGSISSTPTNVAPVLVGENPGAMLNLHVADLNITPSLTPTEVELDIVGSEEGGTVIATYLAGGDKTLTNPAELVLPVMVEDVTATDMVLRGIGFRGGSYTDLANILPLTGAPTTEIRGVHAPFLTDVFYPIEFTQANYYDVLAQGFSNGRTYLNIIPAQYLSDSTILTQGTLRKFNSMNFKLFYSDYIDTTLSGNTPAQSAAPTISGVKVRVVGSNVEVRARVHGDPSAGIQEVWATYTGKAGSPYYGQWHDVSLTQSADDSTVWTGVFPLNGSTNPKDIQVMMHAANGVGLVSLATNLGKYYIPTVDGLPSDPDPVVTNLQLVSPPISGEYGGKAIVSAQLLANGNPVSGELIQFALGSQKRTVVTNPNGVASAEIRLLGLVGPSELKATFGGNDDYVSSFVTNPFTITPQVTTLTLEPENVAAYEGEPAKMIATLTGINGISLTGQTVAFIVTGENGTQAIPLITDNAGRAKLSMNLPIGTYSVAAYFASVLELPGEDVDLTDDRYQPSSASGSITIEAAPVDEEVVIYLSVAKPLFIDGAWVKPQDIRTYNVTTDEWSLFFDGSDVGLYPKDIDAVALLDDNSILMSFSTPIYIKHFGHIDDSDIIRFVPTSLGEDTAGTFEWYFDGSDVGLTTGGEDIDGLTVLSDGRLLISTSGSVKVNGAFANDEDILQFTPTTLGSNTSGQWEFYFDGSDIGLTKNSEDINALSFNDTTGELYFSTLGSFAAAPLIGNGADIVTCAPDSLGSNTSCQLSLFWESALHQAQKWPVNAIHIEQ